MILDCYLTQKIKICNFFSIYFSLLVWWRFKIANFAFFYLFFVIWSGVISVVSKGMVFVRCLESKIHDRYINSVHFSGTPFIMSAGFVVFWVGPLKLFNNYPLKIETYPISCKAFVGLLFSLICNYFINRLFVAFVVLIVLVYSFYLVIDCL